MTEWHFSDETGGVARLDAAELPTPVRDAARSVWARRHGLLETRDSLPQVLSHGDALPQNLLRHDDRTVTAIDWSDLGHAPIGSDLAYFAMWVATPPASC